MGWVLCCGVTSEVQILVCSSWSSQIHRMTGIFLMGNWELIPFCILLLFIFRKADDAVAGRTIIFLFYSQNLLN
jgi:hypothetical protein